MVIRAVKKVNLEQNTEIFVFDVFFYSTVFLNYFVNVIQNVFIILIINEFL